MKSTVLIALAACSATFVTVSQAQETGRVISTTPVISQVAVPRQVCSQSQVQVQGQKSGAGTLLGAVAGGAIGNQMGGGDGKAIVTLLGIVGGAMLGDRVEGAPAAQTQNVQSCTTQTFYENRTTAYNVSTSSTANNTACKCRKTQARPCACKSHRWRAPPRRSPTTPRR